MKELIYKSVKITIGLIMAIYIADLLSLQFTTTAGVITMLSVLDTRKQTFIIGIKRISLGIVSVLISSLIFNLFGHSLISLSLFLLVFIPSLIKIKSTESLVMSTVLVTHIYSIQEVTGQIMLNEVLILLIGIVVAWILNIHMINKERDIKLAQTRTETLIREILYKMQDQLLNTCDLCQQEDLLASLDQTLTKGMNLAIEHNNNYLMKDIPYYIRYFQMRRQQYLLLSNMQKYFNRVFITQDMVKPLSDFTKKLAEEFNEFNSGEELIEETKRLLVFYREQKLPTDRKEFEHRAILFLYLYDMIHFVEIKNSFMKKHGIIKYYGEE